VLLLGHILTCTKLIFAAVGPGGSFGEASTRRWPRIGWRVPGLSEDSQDAFLNATIDRQVISPDRLAAPASPFILQAGTIIPAALITGIRSDLPGQITAQVTENVYDTPAGRYLLIPQGSRLAGEHDNGMSAGQRRVLLVWTRLILPDRASLVLERLQGADASGYAGLEDRVDRHWWGLA
jgi:type IV secretion system protein TrbI